MSKELNADLGTTGLTVTASVYLLGVLKASGIACAEIGVTGKYQGDFTATPNVAGVYQVAFFVDAATTSSGGGQIVWDGAAEVLQTGDNYARLGAPAGVSVSADVATIKTKTDLIPGTTDGLTYAQKLTLMASVLLGKARGLDTTTAIFRSADDVKDRVTATVDVDGNRSSVTLDAT